jgi:predicted secreted protein
MEIVKLKKGKTFVLQLKGLASAGYTWQYTADREEIIVVEVEYKLAAPLTQKNAGASANEIFTITALEKGDTIIHFTQVRSWEDKKIPPVDEKTIKLIITD